VAVVYLDRGASSVISESGIPALRMEDLAPPCGDMPLDGEPHDYMIERYRDARFNVIEAKLQFSTLESIRCAIVAEVEAERPGRLIHLDSVRGIGREVTRWT
jgi:hypothetical protein